MSKAVYQSFEASSEPDKGPERLIMLRDQMRKSGIDAFLIPRADVHQGEYVALLMNAWHGLRGLQDRLVFVPLHRMPRGSSLMAATASKSRNKHAPPLPPLIGPKCNWGIG